MMSGQVQDVLNRFEEAMEKIDGIEKTFETKLDDKFAELLLHFPPPPPAAPITPLQQQQQRPLPNQFGRAKRVPLEDGQTSGAAVPGVDASVAPGATAEVEDHYEDEVDENQNYVHHQHNHHQVVLMHIIATVGLHHHLRYMTIFLN